MNFKMVHNNLNVLDLEKSLDFYARALNMHEIRRIEKKDFIIVYLEDGQSAHQLELTWIKAMDRPYNLGDNEFHLAFRTDDFDGAYQLHKEMNCIAYENKDMGIYFITDPDGYWLEILPVRNK